MPAENEGNSYGQILRSSSIIGGASVVTIMVGMLRTKVVAVLLGPAGVGLIGLFGSLMGTAAGFAGLGFNGAGTRQIAEAVGRGEDGAIAAARRALFWGTLALAITGGVSVWALRRVLAAQVLDDPGRASDVGWLALGVALMVAAASQGALLNGLRKIGDLAWISICGAVLSTVLGIGVIWVWGAQGIVPFVLIGPLSGFLLGHWFVNKLRPVQGPPTPFVTLLGQWRTLAMLGAAFMVSGLVGSVGQLLVRSLIQRELSAEALGNFQAAWAISMTYIGFVLTAMGTDYYPRLTEAIHDHATVNRLVNEQTEVALLLAGPVFLAMLGLASWIIPLLYSSAFGHAVAVLRWQVLGDVLKVVSWPLGFIILASGDGKTFILTESLGIAVFVLLTWVCLPSFGVVAAGIGFLGMYVVYLPVVFWLGRRRTGFLWDRRVGSQFAALLAIAAAVAAVGAVSPVGGPALGVTAAAVAGLYGLGRLGRMTALPGALGRAAAASRRVMQRTGVWRD